MEEEEEEAMQALQLQPLEALLEEAMAEAHMGEEQEQAMEGEEAEPMALQPTQQLPALQQQQQQLQLHLQPLPSPGALLQQQQQPLALQRQRQRRGRRALEAQRSSRPPMRPCPGTCQSQMRCCSV